MSRLFITEYRRVGSNLSIDLTDKKYTVDKMDYHSIGFQFLYATGLFGGVTGNMLLLYVFFCRLSVRSNYTYYASSKAFFRLMKCVTMLPPLILSRKSIIIAHNAEDTWKLCRLYRAGLVFFTILFILIMAFGAFDGYRQSTRPWRIRHLRCFAVHFTVSVVLAFVFAISALNMYDFREIQILIPREQTQESQDRQTQLKVSGMCSLKASVEDSFSVKLFAVMLGIIYTSCVLAIMFSFTFVCRKSAFHHFAGSRPISSVRQWLSCGTSEFDDTKHVRPSDRVSRLSAVGQIKEIGTSDNLGDKDEQNHIHISQIVKRDDSDVISATAFMFNKMRTGLETDQEILKNIEEGRIIEDKDDKLSREKNPKQRTYSRSGKGKAAIRQRSLRKVCSQPVHKRQSLRKARVSLTKSKGRNAEQSTKTGKGLGKQRSLQKAKQKSSHTKNKSVIFLPGTQSYTEKSVTEKLNCLPSMYQGTCGKPIAAEDNICTDSQTCTKLSDKSLRDNPSVVNPERKASLNVLLGSTSREKHPEAWRVSACCCRNTKLDLSSDERDREEPVLQMGGQPSNTRSMVSVSELRHQSQTSDISDQKSSLGLILKPFQSTLSHQSSKDQEDNPQSPRGVSQASHLSQSSVGLTPAQAEIPQRVSGTIEVTEAERTTAVMQSQDACEITILDIPNKEMKEPEVKLSSSGQKSAAGRLSFIKIEDWPSLKARKRWKMLSSYFRQYMRRGSLKRNSTETTTATDATHWKHDNDVRFRIYESVKERVSHHRPRTSKKSLSDRFSRTSKFGSVSITYNNVFSRSSSAKMSSFLLRHYSLETRGVIPYPRILLVLPVTLMLFLITYTPFVLFTIVEIFKVDFFPITDSVLSHIIWKIFILHAFFVNDILAPYVDCFLNHSVRASIVDLFTCPCTLNWKPRDSIYSECNDEEWHYEPSELDTTKG